jgi:hypothetical protein
VTRAPIVAGLDPNVAIESGTMERQFQNAEKRKSRYQHENTNAGRQNYESFPAPEGLILRAPPGEEEVDLC